MRREERAIEGRGEAIVDIFAIARPCYGGYEGLRACSLSKGELEMHMIAGPSESGLASTVDDALGPSNGRSFLDTSVVAVAQWIFTRCQYDLATLHHATKLHATKLA